MLRENDYIYQLAQYIKKNLQKGYTQDSLKFALLDQGYSKSSIDRALQFANEELSKEAPKIKEKPIIKIERIPMYNDLPAEEEKSFWQKLKDIFR